LPKALVRRGWIVKVIDRAGQAASAGLRRRRGCCIRCWRSTTRASHACHERAWRCPPMALNRAAPDGHRGVIPVWQA